MGLVLRAERTYWAGPRWETTVPAMPFDFLSSSVPVRPDILEEFRREWGRLAQPGPTWTGAERVSIAAAARGKPGGDLSETASSTAGRIYREPSTISREWVTSAAEKLGAARYVELVGVVARLAAVDFFHQVIGSPVEPLPEPVPGDPTGETDDRARLGKGWVPMVGTTSIVGALSIVPSEMEAQQHLHSPLYLTYEDMADVDFQRGLHRSQMELVAARTSAINECFY